MPHSANLLSVGLALPLIIASLPAAASENDDVLKIVDDFCANPRDKLKDVGAKASKLGFGAEYRAEAWAAARGRGLAAEARHRIDPHILGEKHCGAGQ